MATIKRRLTQSNRRLMAQKSKLQQATANSSAPQKATAPIASSATTRSSNTPPLLQRLQLPPNFRDVTSEKLGAPSGIIGAENFRSSKI
jgi:hypothetical protein